MNNLNKVNTVPTTVRVPEPFLTDIKSLAEKVGDSQNGMMMNLMYLGMKVYSANFTLGLQE